MQTQAIGTVRSNVINREGAAAHLRPFKEQLAQVLMVGTLQDAFYASKSELTAEAQAIFTEARDLCPEFFAKAIVYARTQGFMKAAPIRALATLSGGGAKTAKFFAAAFPLVIRTPDDLRQFAELCLSGEIPGRTSLGGIALKATQSWLEDLSEYHAVKYGSAASRGVTLRDLVRMGHPKPMGNAALSERFGWLVRGKEGMTGDPGLNPMVRALESLKSAETEAEAIALIRGGRLPYEVVVPALKATTPGTWRALLENAPLFNLLRNLVTFTRHGVFQDKEAVALAVRKLTNPAAIAKSMILPFRFYDAWRAYTGGEHDSRIADALRAALELSFVNLPGFGERTVAIGSDVSGSMSMERVSDHSATHCIDICGLFTGALLRKVEDRAIVLPFEDHVRLEERFSGRDDILVTADKIKRLGGGGTAVGAPIQHLLERKLPVDVFVGITDNVDWAHGDGYSVSGSFLELWSRYRNEVAPHARAYLLTIAPYREVVAPASDSSVRFIYGWSDRVPGYIARDLTTGESQITEIEAITLGMQVSRESGVDDAD